MESAGEQLKKIRLEKGISLEQVHKKTKVHLKILQAIEEDNLISLSPVYIRGFLKIYCKFLGLNPADYIQNFREPFVQVKPEKLAAPKPVLRTKPGMPKLSFFNEIFKQLPLKAILVTAASLILLFGLFKLGKNLSSKANLRAKDKISSSIITVPTKKPSEKETTKAASLKAAENIRLDIKANENCWVELKADGKTMFRGIIKKGKTESWQAKNRIELSLGNAGVVDLEVNGKRISALGRRGQTVKNIVIDKEGLSIKK